MFFRRERSARGLGRRLPRCHPRAAYTTYYYYYYYYYHLLPRCPFPRWAPSPRLLYLYRHRDWGCPFFFELLGEIKTEC